MNIFETAESMFAWSQGRRAEGQTLGLVPTMGALHRGHASLIERAAKENDHAVVSIFVNPLQFGPREDFARYPRTFDDDRKLCEELGVGALFAPTMNAMYPEGFGTKISNTRLSQGLCGAGRPGHFDGVATVCTKLFTIVTPHKAYFGEKDYQQLRIVTQTAKDLNLPVEIVGCPIVREADGLAMSSRNKYLSAEERRSALRLHEALSAARAWIDAGERDAARVKARMRAMIAEDPLCRVEYIALVDVYNLLDRFAVEGTIVLALAVHVGATRLIDNVTLTV